MLNKSWVESHVLSSPSRCFWAAVFPRPKTCHVRSQRLWTLTKYKKHYKSEHLCHISRNFPKALLRYCVDKNEMDRWKTRNTMPLATGSCWWGGIKMCFQGYSLFLVYYMLTANPAATTLTLNSNTHTVYPAEPLTYWIHTLFGQSCFFFQLSVIKSL